MPSRPSHRIVSATRSDQAAARMSVRWIVVVSIVVALTAFAVTLRSQTRSAAAGPAIVTPAECGAPPSDAIVLFDGTDASKWEHAGGKDPTWTIEDGALVAGRGGDLHTKQAFGDIQLHMEWSVPKTDGRGQDRGNSGIKLHTRYELQILDNFGENLRAADQQAGSVYKQHAPLANACRAPGEWQTYDVVFRAPRWDASGNRTAKGRFTVFHNGVLIHDNVEIQGPTNSNRPATPQYRKPFFLQWHGAPVRYRNIWVRELEPRE